MASPPPQPCFVTKEIPGKGTGVVAVEDIQPGQLIIAEPPLFVVPWWVRHSLYPGKELDAALMRLLNDLSDEEEQSFYNLSDCKSRVGEEATEMGIWRTNNFALGRSHSKCSNGIFPKLSRFNHSCVPTAEFRWNEKQRRQEIRAIRSISTGQEICLCYFTTSILEAGKDERREYLRSRYGFDCDCEACQLSGETSEADDNLRGEVKALKSEIDELVYEWVDIEEVNAASADSKSSCDEDVVDQDYSRALILAKRRYTLMKDLGFKAVSIIDALNQIVDIARDMSDMETAVIYAQKGRSTAEMLYGRGSQEVLDWESVLSKCSN